VERAGGGFGGYVTSLFFENKVNGKDEKREADDVIQAECLVFEQQRGEYREYGQRNHFLNHFELPEVKGTAVFCIADAVGRHLKTVFQ
jgi:hypothetical protein